MQTKLPILSRSTMIKFLNSDRISSVVWITFIILNLNLFSSRVLSVYELPKFLAVGVFVVIAGIMLFFKKEVVVNKAFFLMVGWVTIAILFNYISSTNRFRSAFGDRVYSDSYLAIYAYLLVGFYICVGLFKKNIVIKGVTWAGFVLACFSVLHALFLYVFKITEISYDGRITATTGQPNILGGILASIIPINYLVYKNSKGRAKKFYVFSLFLITAAMILTMSRGVYIALGITGFIAVLDFIKSKKVRVLLVAIVILLAGAIFFTPQVKFDNDTPYLIKRFFSFKSQDEGKIHDMRFELWEVSTKPIQEKLLTGWGNSSFQNVYQRYLNKEIAPQSVFMEVESSHNIVVDMLLEWGVFITLFAIIGFILALLKSKVDRPIKYAVLILVLRSFFCILSVNILVLFAATFALVLKELPYKNYRYKGEKALIVKSAVLMISIIVLVFTIFIYKSEIYEKAANNQGDYGESIALYEKALQYNPYKQSLWNRYTSTLLWGGNTEKFKEKNTLALGYFDDYRSNYYMATYYLRQNDLENATKYFNRALELNTRDPKTYHYLGMIYREQGDLNESLNMFLKVIEFDRKNFSDDYVYLSEIYYKKGNRDEAIRYLKKAPSSWRKDYLKTLLGLEGVDID